jgi:hypothetical protein
MTKPTSESRIRRREFLARWNGLMLAGFAVIPTSARRLTLGANAPSSVYPAADLLQEPPQDRHGFPSPPPPADPSDQDKNAPQGIDPQTAKRVMAARNEKEFREGIEHLYQLAAELRDELAQAPKMNVLSVRMYKKTEEIEKLAKQLKSKAKGG